MTFKSTLYKVLNASDYEYVNRSLVVAYGYPGETIDDLIELGLENHKKGTFPLQQEITVDRHGEATVADAAGQQWAFRFLVTCPISPSDVEE